MPRAKRSAWLRTLNPLARLGVPANAVVSETESHIAAKRRGRARHGYLGKAMHQGGAARSVTGAFTSKDYDDVHGSRRGGAPAGR